MESTPVHPVELIEIRMEEVPSYLKAGHFFASLSEEASDDCIAVPSNVIKSDSSFNNEDELRSLLLSLRFWGVDGSCHGRNIVDFAYSSNTLDSLRSLLTDFSDTLPITRMLLNIICGNDDSNLDHIRALGHVQYLHVKHNRPLNHPNWLPPFLKDPDCDSKAGQLEILYYLVEHNCIESYTPDVLKYLEHLGISIDAITVDWAAESGRLDLVTQLHEKGITSRSGCYNSAKNGHLHCLTFMHSKGYHLWEKTSLIAAENGHLHILQYLHENNCHFHFKCCRFAAAGGHLACLKYLHEAGYPWGIYVTSQAAMHGRFECLKYAHEHGCPWNNYTTRDALKGEHQECLQYALDNGCPYDCEVSSVLDLGRIQIRG